MYQDLGNGITCIDTGFVRDNLAACYLMVEDGEVAIIESGTNSTVPRIRQLVAEKALLSEQVKYIIPTHVHLDHAGGVGRLMEVFPKATLVVHPRGARHMIDPAKLIAGAKVVYGEKRFNTLYGDIIGVPEERVLVAEDGDSVFLAGRKLEIRHTPGHAEHHFCVWDENSRGWFSGDNFGISYQEMEGPEDRYVIATSTPVQFDPNKYLRSLDTLMSYQPARIYLTHFGMLEGAEIVKLANTLRKGVEEYHSIGLRLKDAENREKAIREAITEYEVFGLRQALPFMTKEQALELLSDDILLNAQGINVWLERMNRNSS